jgi:superfamily II DNA helicase RecQ
MALTATATPRVSVDIVKQLNMCNVVVFSASFNRPNLSYRVEAKGKSVIKNMAEWLVQRQYNEFNLLNPGIVYCLSREDCEKVAAELEVRTIEATLEKDAWDGRLSFYYLSVHMHQHRTFNPLSGFDGKEAIA